MWELFKSGTLPKTFFETPEVKKKLKQQIEEHKEQELLQKAQQLANKYLNKVLDDKKAKKELQIKLMAHSASEQNMELARLNRKIQMELISRRPLAGDRAREASLE